MARKTAAETERTRQQIIDSAKELFIRKGYGAASMDEICDLSGVSKGSIYYHFKSKEQLFLQLLEQSMTEWENKWREIVKPGMSASDKLYALAEHWVDDFDNPLVSAGEEFAGSYGGESWVTEKLIDISRRHHPIVQDILEEGITAGEFRREDGKVLTYIFIGTMGGLGHTYYEDISRDAMRTIYRTAVDVFIQGVMRREL